MISKITLALTCLLFLCSPLLFSANTIVSEVNLSNQPDVTGKYKWEIDKEKYATFNVTKTSNGIIIEHTGSEGFVESISVFNTDRNRLNVDTNAKAIAGKYVWNQSLGAFRKLIRVDFRNKSRLLSVFDVGGTSLAIRDEVSAICYLKKEQGSLGDLFNSQRSDVSGLIGRWSVENSNAKVELTSGVDYDLLLRFSTFVYELNKKEGGVFDEYTGSNRDESETVSIKVMNPKQLKITVQGNELTAYRGSAPSQNAKSSSAVTNVSNTTTSQSGSTGTSPLDIKFFKAIKGGDTSEIEEVIGVGANVNATDATGRTALHLAVAAEDSYVIEALLDANANINATNRQGRTPLEMAINKSSAGDITLVNTLLERGATVSNYAIDQSLLKDDDELISGLINAGANKSYIATKAIEKGKTALFDKLISDFGVQMSTSMFDTAMNNRKFAIADKMITNGFNPSYALEVSIKKDKPDLVFHALDAGGSANSALTYAIKKNDIELANNAIDNHSADVEKALVTAVAAKNIKMSELLLKKGANPDTQMASVCASGNAQMVKTFLQNNADPNKGLMPAAQAGKMNIVTILLEADADANPLMPYAIEQNNTAMATQALASGADGSNPSFIKMSSAKGNMEIVKALLDNGADPDAGLMAAVQNNKFAVSQALIEAGADASKDSLLSTSTKHNNTQLTSLFINAGANAQAGIIPSVNASAANVLQQLIDAGASADSQSLLTTAVRNNSTPTSKILLDQGLDANGIDSSKGYYMLHYAAENNNSSLTLMLLENGAEVDAVANGSTPLHLAVRDRKALATVQALIAADADVNAVNGKGKKVLKIAKGNKIKKLLKANGAEKK